MVATESTTGLKEASTGKATRQKKLQPRRAATASSLPLASHQSFYSLIPSLRRQARACPPMAGIGE